jgi:hypothetical protein
LGLGAMRLDYVCAVKPVVWTNHACVKSCFSISQFFLFFAGAAATVTRATGARRAPPAAAPRRAQVRTNHTTKVCIF